MQFFELHKWRIFGNFWHLIELWGHNRDGRLLRIVAEKGGLILEGQMIEMGLNGDFTAYKANFVRSTSSS